MYSWVLFYIDRNLSEKDGCVLQDNQIVFHTSKYGQETVKNKNVLIGMEDINRHRI